MIHGIGGGGIGRTTQSAGTRIRGVLGGAGGLYTHLTNFRYTSGATQHTVTAMIDASNGLAASALAAAGTALVCDRALTDGDANAPANLDVLVVRLNTGEWHLSTISAWNSGTKTLTLNTAIPTGKSVLKGAPIFFYGVAGDTYQLGRTFSPATSTSTNFPNQAGGDASLIRGRSPGAPIVLDSDNGTAQGYIEYANFMFAKR